MKLLLVTIFILIFGTSFAQVFSYPKIHNNGSGLSGFIPNGWILLDSVKGDLNRDGTADIAFVIQYQDSARIAKSGYSILDTVTAKPRMLVIAFYMAKTKRYVVIEQSNTFILSHDQPNMDEPFKGLEISNGVLIIAFNIFMNSGAWGTYSNIYKFRYQEKEFRLIGADYHYLNRGTGETEDRSYNFLTGKVKVSAGSIANDKLKEKWRNFRISELKTFKTFRQPFTWKIEKGFYL